MRQHARVTFAMRDLDPLKCIQAVVDGVSKPIKAADRPRIDHAPSPAARASVFGPKGQLE